MKTNVHASATVVSGICFILFTGCTTPTRVVSNPRQQRPTLPDGRPLTIAVRCPEVERLKRMTRVAIRESNGLLYSGGFDADPVLAISAGLAKKDDGESLEWVGKYTLTSLSAGTVLQKTVVRRPARDYFRCNEKQRQALYDDVAQRTVSDLFLHTEALIQAITRVGTVKERMLKAAESGARTKGEVHGVDTSGIHYVYTGEVFQGVADGEGDMHWDNGDMYIGHFRGGLPHGPGKRLVREQGWYKGTFSEGQIVEGSVAYTSQKGWPTFVGKFKNGLPHGPGKLMYASNADLQYHGKTVEGTFENGVLQGEAKITYPSGATLVVNHVNGLRNGTGTYTATNGSTEQWTYHNGSFVENESNGVYHKEAANAPKDSLISTALKLQGLASTIHRVTAKSSGRKFIGKGSPPVNSFDANNQPNEKYFEWAYGE
jgi:hypothetical protein